MGEFGDDDDDSFLENLDIDQVIAQAEAASAAKKKRSVVDNTNDSNNDSNNHNTNDSNKRSKPTTTSTSTSTSTTTSLPRDFSSSSSNHDYYSTAQLESTLQQYFGFAKYRPGQLSVIQALVNHRRDVAVFWATGQGKSLCYQIPALLSCNNDNNNNKNKKSVVLVISPLVSLMQDQVDKLNALGSSCGSTTPLATYLGSAQTDPLADQKTRNGDYKLVYVTPEKIQSFYPKIQHLVSLIAVDEAHMVSEWGHDFRPDFRKLGTIFQQHRHNNNIPILALTATAVPRVQDDILTSLQMKSNVLKVQQSFDRPNLKINVLPKPSSMAACFQDLIQQEMMTTNQQQHHRRTILPTIIYAPTRNQVDEICAYLQQQQQQQQQQAFLKGQSSSSTSTSKFIRIESYHAGLTLDERFRAHTNFLTGVTTIMVASIAFGMGIDKPDIRRVIHYGTPKTLEEYYQQIGRAGRDGLPAECTCYYNTADLDRYKSEYYLSQIAGAGSNNNNSNARQSVLASMQALRKYVRNVETCRRKALLDYFQESPTPFGDRCGTCDTCRAQVTYGGDLHRDFGPLGARVVLLAVSCLSLQGIMQIINVVSGKIIESYRYARGSSSKSPYQVQQLIQQAKEALPKKYTQNYYKELIPLLQQKGYLTETTKNTTVNGYKKSWTVYSISIKGQQALDGVAIEKIMLPVPESIRAEERLQEEKRQKILQELEQNGIPRDKLPEEEVKSGDGEVIRAYSKWHKYLERRRADNNNNDDDRGRQEALEQLLAILEEWRSQTAVSQRMAPASVLPEHVLVSIAYMTATLTPGIKPDAQSLIAAGVRTKEIQMLVTQLGQWVDQYQPKATATSDNANSAAEIRPMVLGPVQGHSKWEYASYKPNKKTGVAIWEASFNRFTNGESPQTIAMTQSGGKQPIQAKTVVGHLLDAITFGKTVDTTVLAEYITPPNHMEWQQLVNAEIETSLDVTEDPNNASGNDGGKWSMTEFLRPIVGDVIVDTPFKERTDHEKEVFSSWCDKLRWYMAFRRVGYEPTFRN